MKEVFLAVILDLILGDPYNFPHPVKLMGNVILREERFIRASNLSLKLAGFLITIANILLSFFIPYFILKLVKGHEIIYLILNTYLIYTCIAARCLQQEAMKVYQGLREGLKEARYRLSFIVGRDTENLNEEEIIKACVETVSENTSDGVIAPLFYIFILGAPGGLMYKMINTMDSMLGYKNKKYKELGYFPAKVDDLFNYIPARLTGILMNLSSIFRFNVKKGFKIMVRDRKSHASPNAIYPEAAVAGLLNIQLGGSSNYFGKRVDKPTIGNRIRKVEKEDIRRAIEIMYRTEFLFLLIYGILIIRSR